MKEHWKLIDLYPGAHIRVKVNNFYHHGIYIGNDEVVQFGMPRDIYNDPKEVKVLRSSIDDFAGGATFIEVYEFDRKELKKKRKDKDIIEYALSKVGEGNYNVLHNNCEHFAMKCVFGEASSKQIDEIYENVKKLMEHD